MKLRVLHVITMLELGGAQRNTLDTVRLLPRGEFTLGLAYGPGGELDAEARELDQVAVYPVPSLVRQVRPRQDVAALFALRRVMRAFRPHIVHTHSSKAGVLGRLAAFLEKVPVIIHSIHGFGFGAHQPAPVRAVFLAAERLVAPLTSFFVAVSRKNLEQGVHLGLFPPEKACVIRSGIHLETFFSTRSGEEAKRRLGIPATAPVVLQVSCFKRQKAPERFVMLAGLLAPRFPQAHFVLVGEGQLREKLEALRAQLGLSQQLHFLGWRRDVPELLAASDVVTLTSRFEGLPRVLVEARACAKPVVAMAVDGVVEVVEDGVNGFLVPEGEVASMAGKVAWLLQNPELAKTLGRAGQKGLEEFSVQQMVEWQAQLYRRLWQQGAGA